MIMARKKKSKKSKLSPSLFKVTGASAKLKVDKKKAKSFYFKAKLKPEKAKKAAAKTAAEIMGVAVGDLRLGRPSLKYEFYGHYDLVVETKFVQIRKQELGVQQEVSGALVGKEVIKPKKGKDIPGRAIHLDIVELYETKRTDKLVFDGRNGNAARSMERLVKAAGKKKASPAWIQKASVAPGKYNSIDKIVKAYVKLASKKPSTAKRVVSNELTFKALDGFYVPYFYVKATAGTDSKVMRVNALNGDVGIKV
jgi:hypothetical protein